MLRTTALRTARLASSKSLRWAPAGTCIASRALSSEVPPFRVVDMPALSPTMSSGTIAVWNKQPGDEVNTGDSICEVQTDKAAVSFDYQDDEAVLAKHLATEKDNEIAVGVPIAILVDDSAAYEAFLAADADGKISLPEQDKGAPSVEIPSTPSPFDAISQESGTSVEGRTVDEKFLLTPGAWHLAHRMHADVTGLQGTGRGGRILKSDILTAVMNGVTFPPLEKKSPEQPSQQPEQPPQTLSQHQAPSTSPSLPPTTPIVTDAPFEDSKASPMRKVIATRLTESKTSVPHFYVSTDCELDALLVFRKKLKADLETTVSVNDLIIRAAGLALRDVPEANASFDTAQGKPRLNTSVDVSVAVATPSGLITPIVTGVDRRGLQDISAAVRELAGRAKVGKLAPEEYQGGTFSVSNLGMFGVTDFSAVINPPQACIMAVGSGLQRVVVDQETREPKVSSIMTVRVSCDRRVIDEATASLFLQTFQSYVTQPSLFDALEERGTWFLDLRAFGLRSWDL